MNIDREGIFKARPLQWRVKVFDGSLSVAIAIEFAIVAQLADNEWQDWSGYDEHRVWGDWWVVKKDGKPNVSAVEQLRDALAWQGSLRAVSDVPPPRDVVVQVTVKADTYNGETRFKATWMNPGDYVPTPGGADAATVDQLDARFGSLLRAAASSKKPGVTPKKPAAPSRKTADRQPDPPMDPSEIPF